MEAKVLVSYYTCDNGFEVHRIYLEPDFEQAEKDLDLLVNDSGTSKNWKLVVC